VENDIDGVGTVGLSGKTPVGIRKKQRQSSGPILHDSCQSGILQSFRPEYPTKQLPRRIPWNRLYKLQTSSERFKIGLVFSDVLSRY
jgi:hypothetical protein